MFLNLLFLVSTAFAGQEFAFVDEGERSPIEGVVLNPEALSEVLVTPDKIRQQCDGYQTKTR